MLKNETCNFPLTKQIRLTNEYFIIYIFNRIPYTDNKNRYSVRCDVFPLQIILLCKPFSRSMEDTACSIILLSDFVYVDSTTIMYIDFVSNDATVQNIIG